MKRGFAEEKRGLSPVIATVLLILLVIVLAAIIFLWAKGFVSEQIEKFGKPIEDQCTSVDFDIQELSPAREHYLEVVNRGSVNINSIEARMFKEGESKSVIINTPIDAEKSARIDVTGLTMDGTPLGEKPEKIVFYPILLGNLKGKDSNKVFTCDSQSKTINYS